MGGSPSGAQLPLLTLTAPDGSVSTPDAQQANVSFFNLSGSEYPYRIFSVQSPQNGIWTLTATNPFTSWIPLMDVVAIFGTDDSTGLQLSAGSDLFAYAPGQTAVMTATLARISSTGLVEPIAGNSGASVSGTLYSAPGTTSVTETVPFFDDGAHDDGAANDGTYGMTFTVPITPGQYAMQVAGTTDSDQRLAVLQFDVQPITPAVSALITPTAYSGGIGAQIGLTSTPAFMPREPITITITMGDDTVGVVPADQTGVLSTTVTVPSDLNGLTVITATGQTSGVFAQTMFVVTSTVATTPTLLSLPQLTLSPAAGPPGMSVAITSTAGFTPGEAIQLTLGAVTLAPVTATNTGAVSVMETVPFTPVQSGPQPVMACGQSSQVCAYMTTFWEIPEPPSVTTVVPPTSGPLVGGTTVVITGSGFTDALTVTFGTVAATFVISSDSVITATAPATTTAGVVDVQVTNSEATSRPNPADEFTYVGPATATPTGAPPTSTPTNTSAPPTATPTTTPTRTPGPCPVNGTWVGLPYLNRFYSGSQGVSGTCNTYLAVHTVTTPLTVSAGSTAYLEADVTIGSGVTLTVQAGAIISATGLAGLFVAGGLALNGTATQPISLTGAARRGSWKGIDFLPGSQGSVSDAHLSYGGAGFPYLPNPSLPPTEASLFAQSSAVTVSQSIVDDGLNYGIVVDSGANPVLVGDQLRNNGSFVVFYAWVPGTFTGAQARGLSASGNANGFDAVDFVGQPVSGRGSWDTSGLGIPLVLQGLTIGVTTTLTLLAGTINLFEGNGMTVNGTLRVLPGVRIVSGWGAVRGGSGIAVSGTLVMNGTPSAPISLTTASAAPGPGQWAGMEFLPGSQGSLSYVHLSYAGIGFNLHQTSILVDGASPSLTNVTIDQGSGNGIEVAHNGAPTLANDTITGNTSLANNAGYALLYDFAPATLATIGPLMATGNTHDAIGITGGR